MFNRVMVTGGTKSDIAAIAVFAMNVKETNSHMFSRLIVYHDGISKKDQAFIKSIMDTEFIQYTLPFKSKNDIIINYPELFTEQFSQ